MRIVFAFAENLNLVCSTESKHYFKSKVWVMQWELARRIPKLFCESWFIFVSISDICEKLWEQVAGGCDVSSLSCLIVSVSDCESECRKQLAAPESELQELVDFRASCVCHSQMLDTGFVCSVCLAVYCKFVPFCCICMYLAFFSLLFVFYSLFPYSILSALSLSHMQGFHWFIYISVQDDVQAGRHAPNAESARSAVRLH